jgi:hypothetical protein
MGMLSGAVVLVLIVMAPTVWASPMGFNLGGVTDGDLTAHVEFAYDETNGTINIDITNTSSFYDPRLTAFAFNVPDEVTGILSFAGPDGWDYLFAPDNINTPGQYGFFGLAAISGPNFNGGKPNDGIAPGSTFSFEFVLTGTQLGLLDELDFLTLLSFDGLGSPDENEQFFIARFQQTGPFGEGSDVAIVPIPSTLLLLGSGLMGFVGLRRKFKK